MNARQKAKKYKRMAEKYKIKAEAWDRHQRSELYKQTFRRGYGTIETLKVVKWWDGRVPVDDELFKREIAIELADCLIREGYIDFKATEDNMHSVMVRKITATLKVIKGGFIDDSY